VSYVRLNKKIRLLRDRIFSVITYLKQHYLRHIYLAAGAASVGAALLFLCCFFDVFLDAGAASLASGAAAAAAAGAAATGATAAVAGAADFAGVAGVWANAVPIAKVAATRVAISLFMVGPFLYESS
jgi:hypothetical protein